MGVEAIDIEEGLQFYEVEDVYTQLGESGWTPRVEPPSMDVEMFGDGAEPEIPEHLDTMWVDDLRKVQKVFGAWYTYVCDQKTQYMIAVKALKEQLEFVEAHLYARKYTGTHEVRKKAVISDRAYVDINSKLVKQDILLTALEARRSKLKECLDIVSRQITMVMGSADSPSTSEMR